MKTAYFIFDNMKEAEYYYRGIGFYLKDENENIKMKRNPYAIIIPRSREIQQNFIGRMLIKLGLKKPTYINYEVEIIFKSKKFNIAGIHHPIYHFEDVDYDFFIFKQIIEEM